MATAGASPALTTGFKLGCSVMNSAKGGLVHNRICQDLPRVGEQVLISELRRIPISLAIGVPKAAVVVQHGGGCPKSALIEYELSIVMVVVAALTSATASTSPDQPANGSHHLPRP